MCTNGQPDERTQSLLEAPPASQGRLKIIKSVFDLAAIEPTFHVVSA